MKFSPISFKLTLVFPRVIAFRLHYSSVQIIFFPSHFTALRMIALCFYLLFITLNYLLKSLHVLTNFMVRWGKNNLVTFSQSCLFSHKKVRNSCGLRLSGEELTQTSVKEYLYIILYTLLQYCTYLHVTSTRNSSGMIQLLMFPRMMLKAFGFSESAKNILISMISPFYINHVHLLLEYDSHIWACATPTTLAFVAAEYKSVQCGLLTMDQHLIVFLKKHFF